MQFRVTVSSDATTTRRRQTCTIAGQRSLEITDQTKQLPPRVHVNTVVLLSTSAFCSSFNCTLTNVLHSNVGLHLADKGVVSSCDFTSVLVMNSEPLQLHLREQAEAFPGKLRQVGSRRSLRTSHGWHVRHLLRALRRSGMDASRHLFDEVGYVVRHAAARAQKRAYAIHVMLLRRVQQHASRLREWVSRHRILTRYKRGARRLRRQDGATQIRQRRQRAFGGARGARPSRPHVPSSQISGHGANGSSTGDARSLYLPRRQLLRRATVWATRGLREAIIHLRRRLLLAWHRGCVRPLLRVAEPVLRPLRLFRGYQRTKRFCAQKLSAISRQLEEWRRRVWCCLTSWCLSFTMMVSALLLLRSVIGLKLAHGASNNHAC